MGIDYDRLPKNEDGAPEYASVLLTLDGRIPNRGNQIIDKFVASTQSPEETLTNLFSYYNEDYIKDMDTTLEAIGRGYNNATAYVYVTAKGVVQIVMATVTFNFLVNDAQFGNGSTLVAMEKLKGMVAGVLDNAANQNNGELPPIHCLIFSYGPLATEPAAEDTVNNARTVLGNLPDDQAVTIAAIAAKMNAAANTREE